MWGELKMLLNFNKIVISFFGAIFIVIGLLIIINTLLINANTAVILLTVKDIGLIFVGLILFGSGVRTFG